MHLLTREEIRQVFSHAQQIHDDIRHHRLANHAHTYDGHTSIAIGTYPGGETVALHGENHLRTIADHYVPRPGRRLLPPPPRRRRRPRPHPMTDTEQAAAPARTTLTPRDTAPASEVPRVETVPAFAADPGDHETLILRIRFDHHTDDREPKWTIAAYETPVSERLWCTPLTPAAPAPVLDTLLTFLPLGDAWQTALGSPLADRTIADASRPLADAGWTAIFDGHRVHWQTQQGDVRVQFDTSPPTPPSPPTAPGPSGPAPTSTTPRPRHRHTPAPAPSARTAHQPRNRRSHRPTSDSSHDQPRRSI